jgi:hypothetical protein
MPGGRENDIWEGMGDAFSIEYCYFRGCKCGATGMPRTSQMGFTSNIEMFHYLFNR